MKTILSAAFVAAILATGTFCASAQGTDGPFCAKMKGDQNAGMLNCSYQTMKQCEEAVKDMGTCTANDKMKK